MTCGIEGSGHFRAHAAHGMNTIMPSTRSCRAMCAIEDVATVLGVLARHDPEALQRCSTVRQKQEILSEED